MLVEGIDKDIDEFRKQINYSEFDIGAVEKFTLKYGHPDIEDYKYLKHFENNLPLQCCENIHSYNGDFVSSSAKILNVELVRNSSIFEVYYLQDWLPSLWAEDKLSKWLVPEMDLQKLFDEYLESGELEEAWFTLNNDQWDAKTINKALVRMQAKTDNELFQLLAKSWRTTFGFM